MKRFYGILLSIVLVFTMFAIPTFAIGATRWTARQETVHQIAVLARGIGLPEDDLIIMRAQELWWEDYYDTREELGVDSDEEVTPLPEVEPEIIVDISDLEYEAEVIAKIMYREARGVKSQTEQACVAWTILNRVDDTGKTIIQIATAPNQFAWVPNTPTTDDFGRSLIDLAKDVLTRWRLEQAGVEDSGRVLPSTYLYFSGSNGHNWFRELYRGNGVYWDYSLESPYDT